MNSKYQDIVYSSINKALEDRDFLELHLWREFLTQEMKEENSWVLDIKDNVVPPIEMPRHRDYIHVGKLSFLFRKTRIWPEKGRSRLVPYVVLERCGNCSYALVNHRSCIRIVQKKVSEFEEIYKYALNVVLEEYPYSFLSDRIHQEIINDKLLNLNKERRTFSYGCAEIKGCQDDVSDPFTTVFQIRIFDLNGNEMTFDTTYGLIDIKLQKLISEGII